MKRLVVWMDKAYKGQVVESDADKAQGVSVFLSVEDNHPVAFCFAGDRWVDVNARGWIKNNKHNKIVCRPHDDGKVMVNTIILSAKMCATYEGEAAKDILGSEAYDSLMAIEMEYGSKKPFIVEIVAMDFKGKDTTVGNGLEFSRSTEQKNIGEFGNLLVHKGHLGIFEDFRNPIGNTVSSKVDDDGNPVSFAYIYPHGEAGELRTNLRLAQAQGPKVLSKYSVSMHGTPIKMEPIKDNENDSMSNIALGGKPYARMIQWKRKSLDFVLDPALEGSQVKRILNSADIENQTIVLTKRRTKVEITLSEIQDFLRERKSIALSDLTAIPCVAEAIEKYVDERVVFTVGALKTDEKHQKEVISLCDESVLAEDTRIKGMVTTALEARVSAVDERKSWVDAICEKDKIKLSKGQKLFVCEGITGEETEDVVKEKIKTASEVVDLSDQDFFLSHKEGNHIESPAGVKVSDATPEQVQGRYTP